MKGRNGRWRFEVEVCIHIRDEMQIMEIKNKQKIPRRFYTYENSCVCVCRKFVSFSMLCSFLIVNFIFSLKKQSHAHTYKQLLKAAAAQNFPFNERKISFSHICCCCDAHSIQLFLFFFLSSHTLFFSRKIFTFLSLD